ncbi:MAG: hypothetical protein ACKOPG_10165 [Novosphingobium sp.]
MKLALRPDPLNTRKPEDIPYVLSGCLGLLLAGIGTYMAWSVLHGAMFRGNVGRTLNFPGRIGLAGAILLCGLALLGLTRWGLRRLKRRD